MCKYFLNELLLPKLSMSMVTLYKILFAGLFLKVVQLGSPGFIFYTYFVFATKLMNNFIHIFKIIIWF